MEYFLKAENTTLHISDSQKGEKVILLLHGYLETLNVWEKIQKELSKSYRVISIDLPGHGLSGTHPESNTLSFSANEVHKLFSKQGIDKASIIGHSMGGYIAVEFLKLFPKSVESIVLINSTPYPDSDEKKLERAREIELIKAGKLQNISSLSIPNMFAKDNQLKFSESIDEIIENAQIHESEGIISSIRGMMQRENNLEVLQKSSVPTMLIMGTQDVYIVQEKARKLIEELPNSVNHIIEGGHILFIEKEVEVTSILKGFLP